MCCKYNIKDFTKIKLTRKLISGCTVYFYTVLPILNVYNLGYSRGLKWEGISYHSMTIIEPLIIGNHFHTFHTEDDAREEEGENYKAKV